MSRAAKGEGSAFKAAGGYRGYVTVNGKRKYFSAKTKAEAAQKKRELLNRRDDGRLVAGKVPTLTQWMNHWLDNVAKVRPTTYAMHKWVIDEKITPELGGIRIDALTAERIEQWVSDLSVKPSSQRRYLAPMKAALNVAFLRGHLTFNPATRVELEAQSKPNTSAYSREDRDAILKAATGYNRARWHVALKIGLRPAEALGLTWPDFDPKNGTLAIRNQILRATGKGLYLQPAPKTDAGERRIRLPKSLVTMLVEHKTEQLLLRAELGDEWIGWEFEGKPVALIFSQLNGRPIGAHTDTNAWRKLLTAAGLSEVRRYKSRHTAATHMIQDSGGDVAVVAKNLGHADAGFTYRTYVHPLEAREAALAEAMDAPYAAPYDSPIERSAAKIDRHVPQKSGQKLS
jgi:integrase